jgi:pimeloyl-ACP methyl ester carboxylesterase
VSAFVLIPGAGGAAWYWNRVVPLLQEAGHEAVAVDLPGDDENAGLPEYTRLVLEAVGGRRDVVLVAQSLGAFTAPLCNFAEWPRIPIRILAGEDDRFFPINFQRRVAHDRKSEDSSGLSS